jgi:Lsr2
MAIKTVYVDDVDGSVSEDVSPVEFSYQGVQYTIDLGARNARKLREALTPFIDHARRPGDSAQSKRSSGPSSSSRGSDRQRLQAIREWARQNGHDVSDRGRLSRGVIDAYDQAHAGEKQSLPDSGLAGAAKRLIDSISGS